MNRRTLLVLGASRYQLDVIRAARRLGYKVVTTDNVPSNPGHALADSSYSVDTTDRESVLEVAASEQVSGVIAACTDVAVPTAAFVASRLQLPGVPESSAAIVTDKLAFRRFLSKRGLPAPRWFEVTEADAGRFRDDLKGAWIVKPNRSSGSKGVFILKDGADAGRFIPEALRFSPNRRAIVEEYLDGSQGTCEGVLRDGRVIFALITDRDTAPPPYVATHGHRVPSRLSAEVQQRIVARIAQVWAALGVANGPFDCDFVVHEGEVYLIEASPRLGGNAMATLVHSASGFDIVEYAVRQACDDGPSLPERISIRPQAVVLLGVMDEGRLRFDVAELDRLRRSSWVRSLSMDVPYDAHVMPFINGRNRVGEAMIDGADRDELDENVATLRGCLRLTVEEGCHCPGE